MDWMDVDGAKKGVKTEIKEDFEIAIHECDAGTVAGGHGREPELLFALAQVGMRSRTSPTRNSSCSRSRPVSWNDVQAFIKKLNEREKGRPDSCIACRRQQNGNMLVAEGPLLRNNARTTSTSPNQPTTCPLSKRISTACFCAALRRGEREVHDESCAYPPNNLGCATCTATCGNGAPRLEVGI